MRNIHDPNEYYKYKITTEDNESNPKRRGSGISISGPCLIVIGIVIFFLISFFSDGASFEAIDTLLAFGLIGFWIVKAMFR